MPFFHYRNCNRKQIGGSKLRCDPECHQITYDQKDASDDKKDDPFGDNKAKPDDPLSLEVYGKKFEKKIVEQVKSMTFDQLLGNVGGLLGLWLGASMLTILEILELLADLLFCSCSWLSPKKRDNLVQIVQ